MKSFTHIATTTDQLPAKSMDITTLRKKEEDCKNQLKKIRNAIEAFQEVCEHDWKPDGHDSHHNYEKCEICGKTSSC